MGHRLFVYALLAPTILCASCSGDKKGAGGGDSLTADLAEKNFEIGSGGEIPGGFSIGFPRTAIPLSKYVLPEGHNDGLLYDLSWSGRRQLANASAQRTNPTKFSALRVRKEIWIDWNGDNRFATEEKQETVGVYKGRTYYKPTGVPTGQDFDGVLLSYAGGEDHNKGGQTEKWIGLCPATYLAGELELGGKSVLVKFVDANMDSSLGPRGEFIFGDTIGIDYNHDGDAFLTGEFSTDAAKSESMQLGATHLFPDGKYYVVKISADLKTVTLIPDPTPTGKVKIDLDVEGMVAVSQGPEFQHLPIIDGAITLRTGRYDMAGLSFIAKDSKGDRWKVAMQRPAQAYLSIGAGTSQTIASNPPYSFSCKAYEQQGRQTIYAWCYDKDGNSVLPYEGLDRPLKPAKCTITNEAGKTVFESDMRWWGGDYVAVWTPPQGAKGIFYLGVRWDLPLLEKTQAASRFRL